MTSNTEHLRQALVDGSLSAEEFRLNAGTSGNISVRCEGGMLITPTGIAPKALRPSSIVMMDLDGNWSGDIVPSTEWALHAAIYKVRPEVDAVVHAHPDYCVALSCMRQPLPPFHYMIASFGGDDVRCSRYETFGSMELADATVEALEGRNACLLANHGMVAVGKSVVEALSRTQKLENLVRQYTLCRSVGEPVLLTDEELVSVKARYKNYGIQPAA
jgi:L-fuculose-phosphate aldolase